MRVVTECASSTTSTSRSGWNWRTGRMCPMRISFATRVFRRQPFGGRWRTWGIGCCPIDGRPGRSADPHPRLPDRDGTRREARHRDRTGTSEHARAGFRGTTLIPLAQAAEGLAVLRSSTYVAYRKRLGEAGASLPERFSDTVAAVADFVDPVLDGLDVEDVWSPAERNWNTAPVTPSEPIRRSSATSAWVCQDVGAEDTEGHEVRREGATAAARRVHR